MTVALPINIDSLLARRTIENERVEYKAGWNPESVLQVPFDDRYNQNASLDDLSLRLIQQYLQDVGSDLLLEVAELSMEVLGRRMNIVGGPSEALFPKNVGLLFFNDHPHEYFPATQIDVVWFPDGAGGDYFEEKEFRGPLAAILRDAVSYIEQTT